MSEETLKNQPEEQSSPNKEEIFSEDMRILEAMLFASEEVLNPSKLKAILPGAPDVRGLRKMVSQINENLQHQRHPFEIVELGGGYQFRTIVYYHPWVRQLLKEKSSKKLSVQALECLAIVAYQQPITKAEIEMVRGVLSDGALKTLLERHMITTAGRSEKPGRPLLYATTHRFLEYFGINKLSDLPRLEEFEEIAREKMEELTREEKDILERLPDKVEEIPDTETGEEETVAEAEILPQTEQVINETPDEQRPENVSEEDAEQGQAGPPEVSEDR